MNHLIIFTRYPEPGKTKTRLIPALGAEGAANLQRKLTEETVAKARELSSVFPVSVEVRFAGGNLSLMESWLGSNLQYREQDSGDLGDRMAGAFQTAFNSGIQRGIIIGIDCPGLNGEILRQALEKLEQNDLVLGPAEDGGYYLIGLRRLIPELFRGINWGTAEVREKTVAIAQNLHLAIDYLPLLPDIDRPEDLSLLSN
ncbi:MAG: TIGR04282 family arsenosugar biosynthesis glycosyltransferase [Cyanobacteriota bacterium]|nr:TIGR04282 family arsenosugar biosynthesis glycosyltransferase [Cyanobacteriota bacterium]